MSLPDSYTQKPGAIPTYFDAILNAEAPDRFTNKFLVNLDFKSTNDRLFVGILKDLGFIDTDGVPKPRYYQFHDRTLSRTVLAGAIKEAYADLFEVIKKANELSVEEVKNKLRTLYAGSKSDNVVAKIASTFTSLCEYADFSGKVNIEEKKEKEEVSDEDDDKVKDNVDGAKKKIGLKENGPKTQSTIDSLQYHINIVLPESRDQAVYDAIFKSLRDHLG